MKYIQKIILCLVFLAFTATSTFAQTDKIVTVYANVLDQAEVQNIADVNFATIRPTGTAKIDPTGTNSGVSAEASYGEVSFTPTSLTGLSLVSIYNISWDETVTLTSSDPAANTMTYTPDVYGKSGSNDPLSGASQLTNGNSLQVGSGLLTGGEQFYIFVGGTIDITDQAVGSYEGNLTITINSLGL